MAHDPKPPAPAAPEKEQPAVISVESATETDANAIPNEREYQEYAQRAMAVLETLQKNGLTEGRGLASAKSKFKKYLSNAAGVKDTKGISHGKWDVIFTEFTKLLVTAEGTKLAVSNVEAAAKEAK